jgi:hypothetical protein
MKPSNACLHSFSKFFGKTITMLHQFYAVSVGRTSRRYGKRLYSSHTFKAQTLYSSTMLDLCHSVFEL